MSKETVHVRLTNRTATLVSDYPYDRLIPYWSFSVPGFQYMKKFRPGWDGRIKMLKHDRLSSGLFRATYPQIRDIEDIDFVVDFKLTKLRVGENGHLRLMSDGEYSFQNDCVDKMVHDGKYGGGLILNATGSGKTRIAAMFASWVGSDICFIVDQLVLLDQARDEIGRVLHEEIGYVGDSKCVLKKVTVATIQTLHRHRNDPVFVRWFEGIEVIIIDEIHDQMNRRNFDVVQIAKPLAVYGLTATLALSKKPVRLKAWALAGPVIYEYPLRKGMAEGVLAKGVAVLCSYENAIRETDATDAREAYDQRVVENAERNHLIAGLVREAHKRHKYTIVIVERIKHLQELSARLKDIPHRIVAGQFKGEKIPKEYRLQAKRRFERGKIRVLIANKVMKKGVDIKRVDVMINAAAKRSANDAIQVFGRGIRRHEDKIGLIHIEIYDTDRYDKTRTKKEKKNWIVSAAKHRKRALKKAGITVKDFVWEADGKSPELFDKAERWLQKEVLKHVAK